MLFLEGGKDIEKISDDFCVGEFVYCDEVWGDLSAWAVLVDAAYQIDHKCLSSDIKDS